MYTLYYAPGACSLSVHIVLEWVGATYKAVKVNAADPDYLKVNPAGAVPALDIGTAAPLTQCSAILQYLARRHSRFELDGHENQELGAELSRWTAFLTGDLHPAFYPVFMPQRYTTDDSEAALANVRAAGMALVNKKLLVIDQHLQGQEYFMGSKRTYVDAYSVPMLRWAKNVLPNSLNEYPELSRHHEQMLQDESVVRAMTDEGILGR